VNFQDIWRRSAATWTGVHKLAHTHIHKSNENNSSSKLRHEHGPKPCLYDTVFCSNVPFQQLSNCEAVSVGGDIRGLHPGSYHLNDIPTT
jgi:hypothetical protein